MKKIIVIAVLCIGMYGCASSTVNYQKPIVKEIQNTKQVNIAFDKAWDEIVKNLSSDFFVINNIDKNSRLINVSFSTNTPSKFIDCGSTKRTFSNAWGTENYDYKTSDSIRYSITKGVAAYNVNKNSSLDGLINIYVAPEGNNTRLTVNGKYVLSSKFNILSFDGKQSSQDTETSNFTTKNPYSDNYIICVSNGVLEQKILDILN